MTKDSWSKERINWERVDLDRQERMLRDIEQMMIMRASEYKSTKDRFADQWVRVHEQRKELIERGLISQMEEDK